MTPSFETRFNAFVRSRVDCKVLDDQGMKRRGKRIADFLLSDSSIIAELKCITASRAKQLQDFVDLTCVKHHIAFYGSAPFSKVFKRHPHSEAIHHDTYKTVGLPLEQDFRSANDQIRQTKLQLDLPTAFGVLILANTGNETLTLDVARWLLSKLMLKRKPNGTPMCSAIDCIWYLTELSSLQLVSTRGTRLLPSLVVPRDNRAEYTSMHTELDLLQAGWATFNGVPFIRPRKP